MSRESKRFASLMFSMWVAAAMGIMWSFGVISNELKEKYQISQATMTWITTSGSAFGMFGLPAGLVFDFFGPPGALLVGGTVTGFGSLLLSFALYFADTLAAKEGGVVKAIASFSSNDGGDDAAIVTDFQMPEPIVGFGDDNVTTTTTLPTPNTTTTATPAATSEPTGPLALIFIGYIMLLHGTTYLDVGGIMATLFVFPLDRGDVITLTRTLTGLGGTFFVFLFNGFFVSQLTAKNSSNGLPPSSGEVSRVYGRYMFVCSSIILGVCWGAAAVIRYPVYHTSGFAKWLAKRRAAASIDGGTINRFSTTPNFKNKDEDEKNSHATIPHNQQSAHSLAVNSNNNVLIDASAIDDSPNSEAAVAQEKEAAKSYYTSIRAAPRRIHIGLFVLGCIFTLFTVVAFMKAAKEKLPDDIVQNLFAEKGNRAVSITSMVLLAVVLPMMALPAPKSAEQQQLVSEENTTASCLLTPGKFLDSRGSNMTAMTDSPTTKEEEEDNAADEKTGLVGSPTKMKTAVNPSYHKTACQFKTSFKQTVTTLPLMWTLMLFAFLSWGAGATIISNSAQILRAVNDNVFNEDLNNLMASVVGVATAVGRIFTGFVDRYYYHQVRYSSAIALPVGPASMLIGALLIVFLPPNLSYFGIASTAFGYGLSWASTMLLVREAFEKDIGRVYYMCSTTAVISVVAFNRGLFGTVFDARGKEQGLYPNCGGIECVRTPMLVAAGLFALGTIFAIITYVQWRRRLLAE